MLSPRRLPYASGLRFRFGVDFTLRNFACASASTLRFGTSLRFGADLTLRNFASASASTIRFGTSLPLRELGDVPIRFTRRASRGCGTGSHRSRAAGRNGPGWIFRLEMRGSLASSLRDRSMGPRALSYRGGKAILGRCALRHVSEANMCCSRGLCPRRVEAGWKDGNSAHSAMPSTTSRTRSVPARRGKVGKREAAEPPEIRARPGQREPIEWPNPSDSPDRKPRPNASQPLVRLPRQFSVPLGDQPR